MQISGGYVVVNLGHLVKLRNSGLDARTYLAFLEIIARRCGKPTFVDLREIHELTGRRPTRAGLARLQEAGLLRFDEGRVSRPRGSGRLVPLPRRLIRFLAASRRPSLIATALGHAMRCLWLRKGECTGQGRCKASAIAEAWGLDLRRIKSARADLIRIGWLEPVASPQWMMNRWGAEYSVNLDWLPPPAPRKSPPPDSDKDPVPGHKNQEPQIRGVSIEDLKDTARLLQVPGVPLASEADRLRAVAAAEHALDVATSNAPGLFATIVRKGLWKFITQGDEDAARLRLREHDYPPRPRAAAPMVQGPQLSADQRLAREVIAAANRAGFKGDPFYVLRQKGWTRPRWEAAIQTAATSSRSTVATL